MPASQSSDSLLETLRTRLAPLESRITTLESRLHAGGVFPAVKSESSLSGTDLPALRTKVVECERRVGALENRAEVSHPFGSQVARIGVGAEEDEKALLARVSALEGRVEHLESLGHVTAHEGMRANALAPRDERGAQQHQLSALEARIAALEDALHTEAIKGPAVVVPSPAHTSRANLSDSELLHAKLPDLESRIEDLEQIVKLDERLGKGSVERLSEYVMARVLAHLRTSIGHSGMPSVG